MIGDLIKKIQKTKTVGIYIGDNQVLRVEQAYIYFKRRCKAYMDRIIMTWNRKWV